MKKRKELTAVLIYWGTALHPQQTLILPIEVDLLLVGFDGDGGYGYSIDHAALDELLGTATGKAWARRTTAYRDGSTPYRGS